MRDDEAVRTTLDLDDDVLQAVKELAEARGLTAGKALSNLARAALTTKHAAKVRNGVQLLPPRPAGSPKPTMRRVNELRDDA
jgi:hypothetical protein